MSEKNSVMDLLTDEIKDLYSAEKQLIRPSRKWPRSNDASLTEAFTAHLKETEQQVVRLEKVAEILDQTDGKEVRRHRGMY
jgi:ferritin-like metal-binding protein YciE